MNVSGVVFDVVCDEIVTDWVGQEMDAFLTFFIFLNFQVKSCKD